MHCTEAMEIFHQKIECLRLLINACYNALDVMKMKRYFVSKIVLTFCEKKKLRKTYEIREFAKGEVGKNL